MQSVIQSHQCYCQNITLQGYFFPFIPTASSSEHIIISFHRIVIIRILSNRHNSILDILQSIPQTSFCNINLITPLSSWKSSLALKYFLNEIQTFRLIFKYLFLRNSPALLFITLPLLLHYLIFWWWETAFNFSTVLCSHIFWTGPHPLLISTPTPFTKIPTQPNFLLSSDVNLFWKDILDTFSMDRSPCCMIPYNPGHSSTIGFITVTKLSVYSFC